MSTEILIQELRKKGEEKVAALWEKTREEEARLKEQSNTVTETEKDLVDRKKNRHRAILKKRMLREMEQEARIILGQAEKNLTRRLYDAAEKLLPELAENAQEILFSRLCAELPDRSWMTVYVNPRDQQKAASRFPEAEIVPEPDILAGYRAVADNGRFSIDNTLKKRFERAWPQLFPDIIAAICREQEEKHAG